MYNSAIESEKVSHCLWGLRVYGTTYLVTKNELLCDLDTLVYLFYLCVGDAYVLPETFSLITLKFLLYTWYLELACFAQYMDGFHLSRKKYLAETFADCLSKYLILF